MKKLSRLTALLLALMMLVTSMPLSALADTVTIDVGTWNEWVSSAQQAATEQENETETVTTTTTVTGATDVVNRPVVEASLTAHAGTETSEAQSVTLPIAGKLVLNAYSGAGSYQWQVKAGSQWANIVGDNGSAITLTYAKIRNALSGSTAQVRCVMQVNGEAYVSATAKVSVDETVTYTTVETQSTLTVTSEQPVARTRALTAADAGIMLADAGEYTNNSIVVNYVFEDNTVAATAWTGSFATGSSFKTTIKNPTVQGYAPAETATILPNGVEGVTYSADGGVVFAIDAISSDITVNVVYQPTLVNYTVIHYQQNVDNDNYTIAETETKQGLTKSTVPEVAKDYPGFYALLYEKPVIAADGSTVVEVYYDRSYYLMNFDLGGGYGVEPIYARYGAAVSVGEPTRAGYAFAGWLNSNGDNVGKTITTTMPAENVTYTADWTENETAKVTVVFWGENPNDEEYSYLTTGELMLTPNTEYTYNGTDQLYLYCDKEAHTHDASCLICGKEEHTQHTEACWGVCTHTEHTLDCYSAQYGGLKALDKKPDGVSVPSVNGVVEYVRYRLTRYYLYFDGTWYQGEYSDTTEISLNCTHTHSDDCYSCETHAHTDACYRCGKESHTHDSTCTGTVEGLNSTLWTFVKSDTDTVAADGSTVINVYYDRTTFTMTFKATGNNGATLATITDKWGADIKERFETISKQHTFLWSEETDGSDPWTSFMDVMPAENRTYYAKTTSSTNTQTATYLVQKIGTEAGNVDNYEVLYTVSVKYGSNLSVSEEEFVDIEGFTFNSSLSTKEESSYNGAKFYYDRHHYAIEYYSPTTLLKKTENVPYEAELASYDWTPDASLAPAQYEPGSVEFAGWYLNPECTGEEFVFTSTDPVHTMPAGTNDGDTTLTVYAKWLPVTHTVSFYLDYDEYVAGTSSITTTHPQQKVTHGQMAETVAEPENGDYKFIGWFYMDNGTEKAFDFANMAVTKDMQVYAKWSSDVLKEYSVYFKIQGTDTQIADPITGSGLAGFTKTFDAKGGDDLYAAYQEGYFPLVKSHSLTLDINTPETADGKSWTEITNADGTKKIVQSFTFEYVQKDAVPYIVRYVDEEGNTLREQVVNDTNKQAVVTEKFVAITGYMPDAYQKRLVLTAENATEWIETTNANGETVLVHPDNVITFVYSEDLLHAYYKITHYTQNTDGGENWTEYASSQAVGDIGMTYTAEPLTIDGFTYDSSVEGTVVSGKLTENGLELKLYYTRNSYPYEVRYLEQGTGKQLAEPKTGTDLYGKVVSESAIDIDNYTVVAPASQTLTIKIEESQTEESQTEAKLNIITFYYTEKEATINYEVVGPDGCGTVEPASETVKVITGYATGSTATPASNVYKFVGWYDKDDKLVSSAATFVPDQPGRVTNADNTVTNGLWPEITTYYAKFEYNLTTLTITKAGDVENTENFIFNVTSGNQTFRVAITGNNGSKVIGGLTVGDKVTVTEETGWSNRYTPSYSASEITLVADPANEGKNKIVITNGSKKDKWLYDEAVVHNNFGNNTAQ